MGSGNECKISKNSDRINQIRQYFCDGKNDVFASKIGKSWQYASAICNGKKQAGNGMLEEILTAFPEVSRTWLYFGEGEMLRTDNSNEQHNVHVGGDNIVNGSSKNTMDGMDRLLDIISSQQKTIQELTEQNKVLTQIIASKIQLV